ncbi:MAG: beta-ketoacyl synthase N-terminal-like domain-containing protein, partial [Candidatus Parabeggiatoa sp.]
MKDYSNCVITGYGVCVPAGCDSPTYWNTISNNKQVFTKKSLFGSTFADQVVAVIDDADVKHGLSKRQTKKLDRFTILAIAAARQALAMSHLPNDPKTLAHCGIMLGNNTGGWGFVEPQMGPLYAEGMDTISPYVATAWFPTATQGEISILFGLGGYSKTFSAENISAGFAFEHAISLLQEGVLNTCLVGGTEAPVTQLVYNACMSASLLSEEGEYRPYTNEAQGTVLGEGSALFVLETRDMANRRGAKVQASFEGIGKGSTLEIS